MNVLQQSLGLINQNQFYEAEKLLKNQIRSVATTDELHVLSLSLFKQHKLLEGIQYLKRAIAQGPVNSSMLFNLAKAFFSLGELQSALIMFKKVLEKDPRHEGALAAIGEVFQAQGSREAALDHYLGILAIAPLNESIAINASLIYVSMGQLQDAEKVLKPFIFSDLGSARVFNNLGNIKARLGQRFEAIAFYTRAIRIDRKMAEAYSNRAAVLCKLKDVNGAERDISACLALDPRNAQAKFIKGTIAGQEKRISEASFYYGQAFEFSGRQDIEALSSLINSKLILCDWGGLEELSKLYLSALEKGVLGGGPLVTLMINDAPHLNKQSSICYHRKINISSYPSFQPKLVEGGRIRLAYVSPDFGNHPVSQLILEMLEEHDRSIFEVFLFAIQDRKTEPMQNLLRGSVEHFIDLSDLSDKETTVKIRDHHLDIAVDLGGYTAGTKPGVFKSRVAPIQINFLGFPGTLGSQSHDYIVADHIVIPEEMDSFYTEKVIRLEGCFQPNDSRQLPSGRQFTRSELGLPEGAFVFCCFNAPHKITPSTFESWMAILKSVEDSVLWLYPKDLEAQSNLLKNAEAYGVRSDRIIFAEFMQLHADHLARMAAADLFLDTFPYGAHTTGSEALRSGIPLLTLQGSSYVSRVGSSLLTRLGFGELITTTRDEYVKKAIEIAKSPTALLDLKSRLARENATTDLFDGSAYCRRFESALRQLARKEYA
jgi:protein O-GlcNAc transferase